MEPNLQPNPLETDPIPKLIVRYAVPTSLTLMVNYLYNIVDQIFVGQGVGITGMAATNIAFPLTILVNAVALMLGDGCAANISLCLGRKEQREADSTISHALTLILASGLLAARPGMGKTSFALNVALNVAKAVHKTVAVFSLEMSREQLATRLLASEALVENNRLKTGALRETDWEKIAGAATILNKVDIRIDDNPMLSVADMNAKCRRLDDLGLVVIDYLQLMTSAGGKGYAGENRQQVVSDISRMLKIMAKELNVPVICLSQLSRASEKRDDKRPMLSDLRESGAIEQDADIVLFLYRDDYYNEDSEKHNIAECIVAKNRHGETGKVELRWMPEYTQFSTLDTRYDED